MKKKFWIWIIAAALLLVVLLVPISKGPYEDGGTREYTALTYKLVSWNRLTDDGIHQIMKLYPFPDNFKSIDELWTMEEPSVVHRFQAVIVEMDGTSALVEPLDGEEERLSSDRFSISIAELEYIRAEVGSIVDITYTGGIRESYPAQIDAQSWSIAKDLRHMAYDSQWLDKTTAEILDSNSLFDHIIITKIYSDCFFAAPAVPMPYEIKLNGQLSENWCVGDQIVCTYENVYYDEQAQRYEADFLSVEPSNFELDPTAAYKPVIYLYPESETDVSVELLLDGALTCTYPAYGSGWNVTAAPDGTLTDSRGLSYNYLYWEGETNAVWDMTRGFCVKGSETATFLENALSKLGLTRREANEFIVYWLPLMEQNPYNLIAFQTDAYTDAAQLNITPAPDTVIRVFMVWKGLDTYVPIQAQTLSAPARTGFTVVEWGGTELSG